MLIPNNYQNARLFQFAGTARFAYNWALEQENKNYEAGEKIISDYELRRRFTKYKNEPDNQWLYTISNNVCKQAIKDVDAYRKFFSGLAGHSRYKSRKRSKPTVGIEMSDPESVAGSNDGIGIDLGVKDLAICSNGYVYRNINKTSRVRRLKKKQRRLQRRISRKYEKNKKGGSYQKTRNIVKSEKQLLRVTHRLTDIRTNYIHQVTTEIVKRKPSFIVMEDLNVSGMMKNKHLARAVQEQKLAEFIRIMRYKCYWNGIRFITAGRFYASSKTCSVCGHKNGLKLSDRIYRCDHCGTVIDRDYNASINLYHYGQSILAH